VFASFRASAAPVYHTGRDNQTVDGIHRFMIQKSYILTLKKTNVL